jgi:hypothetical protein
MDDSPSLTHLVDDNSRKTGSSNNDEVHFSALNASGGHLPSSPVEDGQNHKEVN